ncbi:dihydroorotate dehydrogenase electron transfer subunit [Clostridium sp. A1-XYC3]|uniref:Dihydroorotate dehydrogenase B (NAD(+)), electron transfer subunit n=1 Tax=Clostridium tanneri TaxID=3037988 RepID=A0ABU4JSS4_9CLOT|nr:dihydroorotate dehydrogenase electron transfer subunit [Clostridium sp. A1-XYC3]MDW8801184.1 dihydroorotate dehydrogenase electron transfer subunit [Clostridium sp. A1-XYC3]
MKKLKIDYIDGIVYENVQITDGIYRLVVKGNFNGNPGQFYMLRSWENEPLLGRPISINEISEEKITFLYQVYGEGTKLLSEVTEGNKIQLMGPLGNGFDIEKIKGKVAIVTGGIGVAPMLYAAERLEDCEIDLYAGFREETYGLQEFKKYVKSIQVSTENGKEGHRGYITEVFSPGNYDMVLCCGPEIMMNKVVKVCNEANVTSYVSMEKHMACGIGACLVCTCKTRNGNKRTCKDGPVFLGSDLEID